MFSLIVAFDENNGIGYKGSIPWHLSEDLKQFKQHTINKRIVMGSNTFKSIGKPLPNRHTIVVTSKPGIDSDNVSYICDLKSFLEENKDSDEEIMICGGASIYKECLAYCKKMYISHVNGIHTCDTYFPYIDYNQFEIVNKSDFDGFSLVEYKRKD